MKPAQWCAITAGLLLMAGPSLLSYTDTPAADLHWTIGPLLISFGIVALWAATRDVRWANTSLAVVLVAGPLVISHSAPAAVLGIAAAVGVAVGAPFGGADRQKRGGGWRAVALSRERS